MKNLELASPLEMSASARAGEITAILAAAIVRTLVAGTPTAYFSDRGRLFQADRGRRIGVAVAALGKRAGTGVNVS